MTCSGPFIASAPHHIIHPGGVDVVILQASTIIADLELERYGYRTVNPDPTYAYLHPDGSSLVFWRDPVRTAEDIKRFSAHDAKAYLEFMETLDALMGVALPMMRTDAKRPSLGQLARVAGSIISNRRQLGAIIELMTFSSDQVLAERFEHPMVIGALLGLAAGAGPISGDGSGLAHVFVGLLHRFGSARPIGGMQALPNALAARLQAGGGTILTGTPVSEILVEKGRAEGVRLADGQVIRARAVVAACDPKTALGRLLPAGVLSKAMQARVDYIPANASGAAPMTVHLALSGRVQMSRHQALRKDGVDLRKPAQMIGSPEEMRLSYAAAARGELAPAPSAWAIITTASDPTQAPEGQDSLYLYPLAVPLSPPEGWPALKERAVKAILDNAGQYFDNLEALELGRMVATPEDLRDYMGATNGCVLHVDFNRSAFMRPALGLGGYETPVEALFLGASGSHPGGAISGMPGQLSSRRVLRYLARSRR